MDAQRCLRRAYALQVDVADNIDLLTIIQEYEDVFESRYGKRPKLVRLFKEQVRAPVDMLCT
jgi:hypothetical protein